jgi:hypothetical protein
MKSYSASALVLLCICLCFGNLHSLKAQDNFTASPTQTDMCVHWINGVVPAMTKLDPVEFCSGRKTSQGGWYSTKCRHGGFVPGEPAPGNCTFIGLNMPADTMAVNVQTVSADGHEFLAATTAPRADNQRAVAMFYSRTAVNVGGFKAPPGMYKLYPYETETGWKLSINRLRRETNGTQTAQRLATVEMNTIAQDLPHDNKLETRFSLIARHCPGQQQGIQIRELEFAFGNTDVSVCMCPDQISPLPQDALTEH